MTPSRKLLGPLLAAVFALGVGGGAEAASDPAAEIRTVLPKDAIPSIDEPKYASLKEADKFMANDEMVIGIDIGGQRRAYSVPYLSSHEIVNDVVGGAPISVTW